MASTIAEPPLMGSQQAAISNLVVRAMSEYTGRGPTRARTHINDNIVTVVLQDTLTKGERSLVSDGLQNLVLNTRKAYQDALRRDLIEGVESILGRRVCAFLSDNHIDPDIAVETFVLAPRDAGPRSGAADGAIAPVRDEVAGAHS